MQPQAFRGQHLMPTLVICIDRLACQWLMPERFLEMQMYLFWCKLLAERRWERKATCLAFAIIGTGQAS